MTTPVTEQAPAVPAAAPKRGDRLGPHLVGHAFGGGAFAIVSALAAGVTGAAVVLVVVLAGLGAGLLGLGAGLRKRQQRRAANRTAAARRPGLANRALSRAGLPMIKGRSPGGAGRSALGGSAPGGGRSPGKFAGLRGKLPAALGGTRGKGPGGRVPGTGAAGSRIPGGGGAPGKGRLPGGGAGGSRKPGGKFAGLRGKLPRALGGTRGGGLGSGSGGSGAGSASGGGRIAKLRGKLPRALGGIKRRSTSDGTSGNGSPGGGSPGGGSPGGGSPGGGRARWWHKLFADGDRPEKEMAKAPDSSAPGSDQSAGEGGPETATRNDLGPGTRGFTRREEESTMVIGKASVPKRGAGNGGGTSGGNGAMSAAAQEFVSAVARVDSSTATSKKAYAADISAAGELLARGFANAGAKLGERWNDPAAQEACNLAQKQVLAAVEAIVQAQQHWERREAAHLEHIANPKGKGEDGQHGLDVSQQG